MNVNVPHAGGLGWDPTRREPWGQPRARLQVQGAERLGNGPQSPRGTVLGGGQGARSVWAQPRIREAEVQALLSNHRCTEVSSTRHTLPRLEHSALASACLP